LTAQSIINKHVDYTVSGLPVVSTQENEEFKKLIEAYQMGFSCIKNECTDLVKKDKVSLRGRFFSE